VKSTGIDAVTQKSMLEQVSELTSSADKALKALEELVEKCAKIEDVSDKAEFCRDKVIPTMCELRQFVDELEMNVDADLWPLPTYAEMLFLK
jgi:glutamine synthetase